VQGRQPGQIHRPDAISERSVHVKDAISAMLRAWAKTGGPRISVAAWAMSASGSAPQERRHGELYTGDALLICRALAQAPIEVREILFAHYCVDGSANAKAKVMEISPARFWARVETAYWYLAGRLEVPDVTESARPPAAQDQSEAPRSPHRSP